MSFLSQWDSRYERQASLVRMLWWRINGKLTIKTPSRHDSTPWILSRWIILCALKEQSIQKFSNPYHY